MVETYAAIVLGGDAMASAASLLRYLAFLRFSREVSRTHGVAGVCLIEAARPMRGIGFGRPIETSPPVLTLAPEPPVLSLPEAGGQQTA